MGVFELPEELRDSLKDIADAITSVLVVGATGVGGYVVASAIPQVKDSPARKLTVAATAATGAYALPKLLRLLSATLSPATDAGAAARLSAFSLGGGVLAAVATAAYRKRYDEFAYLASLAGFLAGRRLSGVRAVGSFDTKALAAEVLQTGVSSPFRGSDYEIQGSRAVQQAIAKLSASEREDVIARISMSRMKSWPFFDRRDWKYYAFALALSPRDMDTPYIADVRAGLMRGRALLDRTPLRNWTPAHWSSDDEPRRRVLFSHYPKLFGFNV